MFQPCGELRCLTKLLPKPYRSKPKAYFPSRKARRTILCSSFVKMPSSSDKTAATTATCTSFFLLSWQLKGSWLANAKTENALEWGSARWMSELSQSLSDPAALQAYSFQCFISLFLVKQWKGTQMTHSSLLSCSACVRWCRSSAQASRVDKVSGQV